MDKLIVQVRVNEGQMRAANPHVPYSPEEIAQTVVECRSAGASVVHWHAREPETGARLRLAPLSKLRKPLFGASCAILPREGGGAVG